MSGYAPPFALTHRMTTLLSGISESLGEWKAAKQCWMAKPYWGRLWQTLILSRWQPILAYLPVETVIKRRQQAYYEQLGSADAQGDCTAFIEFLLAAIAESLLEAIQSETTGKTLETVLGLLAKTPTLTVPELAAHLGKSALTIHRAIRKLRESGRLERVGPDKGGHWRVLPAVPD